MRHRSGTAVAGLPDLPALPLRILAARLEGLLPWLLAAVAVCFAQRDLLGSGFDALTGDEHDGLIAYAIIGHWHQVFSGDTPWHRVAWFHQAERTLGYNDAYFLFGILAQLFRCLGMEAFLAAELSVVVAWLAGYLGAYMLARSVLELRQGWAALGALLAVSTPGLATAAAVHLQLHAVGFGLLWYALLQRGAAAFLAQRAAACLAFGIAAALLGGALLLTAFYVFWTFGLALLLGCCILVAIDPRGAWPGRQAAWLLLPVPMLAFVASLLPALWLYLPLLRQTGGHDLASAAHFALTPLSLIDTGRDNPVWGWLGAVLEADGQGGTVRSRFPPRGIAPCTMVLALAAAVPLWRCRGGAGPRLALGMLAACLLLVLATVDFGGGLWPWARLMRHVPGAAAIREISRVLVILAPLLALFAIFMLQRVARRAAWVAALLLPLLMIEQLSPLPPTMLSRSAELARVGALLPPPPGCAAFVGTVPRAGVSRNRMDSLYSHNVDAMVLATHSGLPTPNGFASFNPPGWDFAAPNAPNYADRLHAFLARSPLPGPVCGVDFAGLRWAPPGQPWHFVTRQVPLPAAALGGMIRLADDVAHEAWLSAGFHGIEPWGAWTKDRARLELPLPAGWQGEGELVLRLQRFAAAPGQAPVGLRLLGGATAAIAFADGGMQEVRLPFGPGQVSLHLEIEDPRAVAPAALGVGTDQRVIGVGVIGLGVMPRAAAGAPQ